MGVYSGIITAASHTDPAPSSEITYTVDVNTRSGVVRMPGVPIALRRIDDDLNVRPLTSGQPVIVLETWDGDWFIVGAEFADYGDCEAAEASGGGGGSALLDLVARMSKGERAAIRQMLEVG